MSIAKCGDLSCDRSVCKYSTDVWDIKSVEVPNPALNPTHRIRSHSHLHLNQENSSLDRGMQSYNTGSSQEKLLHLGLKINSGPNSSEDQEKIQPKFVNPQKNNRMSFEDLV